MNKTVIEVNTINTLDKQVKRRYERMEQVAVGCPVCEEVLVAHSVAFGENSATYSLACTNDDCDVCIAVSKVGTEWVVDDIAHEGADTCAL